jgi:hypothetical protein
MIRQILWDIQGLTCREATRLSAKAMDRRLTLRERASLCVHGLLCGYCRNYIHQIRLLRKWARRMGELEISTSRQRLPSSSACRIKKQLETKMAQGN